MIRFDQLPHGRRRTSEAGERQKAPEHGQAEIEVEHEHAVGDQDPEACVVTVAAIAANTASGASSMT